MYGAYGMARLAQPPATTTNMYHNDVCSHVDLTQIYNVHDVSTWTTGIEHIWYCSLVDGCSFSAQH